MSEKSRTIHDVPNLTDEQLTARTADWMGDLHEVTATILKDGILMLLLEQNRRSTDKLAKSSRTLEKLTRGLFVLTIILTVLTAALIWIELAG